MRYLDYLENNNVNCAHLCRFRKYEIRNLQNINKIIDLFNVTFKYNNK